FVWCFLINAMKSSIKHQQCDEVLFPNCPGLVEKYFVLYKKKKEEGIKAACALKHSYTTNTQT
ncbi:hypothetical protein, partial [Salmonella sp. s57610]|uniref:hypothetical protein n=1 Tax=Salmonella sp. s57610 TaxID=3159697 RepID=UPI0039806424